MPVEQLVMQKLRTLPLEQQEEVLHFVEFLTHKQSGKAARQSVEGFGSLELLLVR